ELAAREDRVAERSAMLLVAQSEEAVHAGEIRQLFQLIVAARLPGCAVHFLQADDIRLELIDRIRELLHMAAVEQFVVSRDVVRDDDERLRPVRDSRRKGTVRTA